MRRAYKFRAYPTRPQQGRAAAVLRDHCDLYNAALEERREAWRKCRVSLTYGVQSAQLKEIRRADPGGQGRHSFTAQQQTLRRLDTVFSAFYARAAKGRAGYPRFKPCSRFDQVMFVNRDGARWQPATGSRWARASLQAVGSVKVRQHRPVPGTVKTLQLKREHRRWYVIVVAEAAPVPLPATCREIGADLGVARFLTTCDGEVVANPRFLAASQLVIAELQRRKDRARRGSGNRKRIRRQLAREWRKVRNRRGRRVVLVNPAGTSITCHACGQRCTRPRQDTVICPRCGPWDADVNGARNIYARAGLGSGQAAPPA